MANWNSNRVKLVSKVWRAEQHCDRHGEWSCKLLVTALDWTIAVDWETWAGYGAIGGGRCCDATALGYLGDVDCRKKSNLDW